MSRLKQWIIVIAITALSFGVLVIMARAEEPVDYKLTLTGQELLILSDGLSELPFKRAAALIAKLRAQVDAQEAARKAAAEKPAEPHQ